MELAQGSGRFSHWWTRVASPLSFKHMEGPGECLAVGPPCADFVAFVPHHPQHGCREQKVLIDTTPTLKWCPLLLACVAERCSVASICLPSPVNPGLRKPINLCFRSASVPLFSIVGQTPRTENHPTPSLGMHVDEPCILYLRGMACSKTYLSALRVGNPKMFPEMQAFWT